MTQEGKVPDDFVQQIREMVRQEVANAYRSAPLQNSRISEGGITITNGFLQVKNAAGTVTHFLIGGITPVLPDGSPQQGMVLRREDGTLAMALFDPVPDPASPDGFKQFLGIYDRSGHVVFSDDTTSGEGHARPWLSGGFTAAQYANFRYSTTSATWVTLCDQLVTKQQPRLQVGLRVSMDTAGTTGEIRVLVNGVPLGSVTAEGFVVMTRYYSGAVAGEYGDDLLVEIQGQRTSASGTLRLEPRFWKSRQS